MLGAGAFSSFRLEKLAASARRPWQPTRPGAANDIQPEDQLKTDRAMTIRCTSLVPSPISQSFASRK